MKRLLFFIFAGLLPLTASAQDVDSLMSDTLDAVNVTVRRPGVARLSGAENGMRINRDELFRAACCNLGESFTTNPSVDVSYSDAATGAKQIKLLGLSGTYVQMLTENLPNLRGAATPYALDYVPGPWMQSIQVSKGASSVRNGFESITGQIDIEYLKPDDDEGFTVNLYGNTLSRFEANADGNVHLSDGLSTELLLHFQDDYAHHDANDDGFQDQPNVRQWNLQNRWKWRTDRYLFHAGVAFIKEERNGGQISNLKPQTSNLKSPISNPYRISAETDRYEAYMKHAFILNPEHGTNIALMASGSLHQTVADYGLHHFDVNQKTAYAQLMFETSPTEEHNISAGLSLLHDYYSRADHETTPGAYVQYTYTLGTRLTAMAGLRADHSSRYGWFVTPRLHLKYMPADVLTLRLSLGKGYRTPHAMAENHFLLATGRQLVVSDQLQQEEAWNAGLSAQLTLPVAGRTLRMNAEYYHTRFVQQMVIDYDSDPRLISITDLDGRSRSNTIQVDATYPVLEDMEVTAAWRWNDVKTTYGGVLRERPLTSRYKALLTASYKPGTGLWQFDVTAQLNGGGRLPSTLNPSPSTLHPSPLTTFPAYGQLAAQVTRWFRHFSVYVGGENLTGYRQQHPVIGADDPWGPSFDATQVWGPVHGALFYAGVRINFGRL